MKRDTRIVAWFVAAIPVAVVGTSMLCTWAVVNGAAVHWRLLFRLLCHGMPSRSFGMFGSTLPICARCTGIYAGLLLGAIVFAAMPWINQRLMKWVLLAAAIPIGIDGVTQAMGLRESTNALRLATGLVVACAFGIWSLSAIERGAENAFHPS